MVKFIRTDGEAIWVNPHAVSCVKGCSLGAGRSGCSEIYYIGERDKGDIVAEAPNKVADKLAHAMKYGTC